MVHVASIHIMSVMKGGILLFISTSMERMELPVGTNSSCDTHRDPYKGLLPLHHRSAPTTHFYVTRFEEKLKGTI